MHSSLHEKFVETYFDVFSLCAIFNVGVGQNGKLDPSSVRYNRVDLGNPTFTNDTDRGKPWKFRMRLVSTGTINANCVGPQWALVA